jgi:regulator of sigma E protease
MIAVLFLLVGMAALSLAHELGHAAVARSLGLHITHIGIGLGPAWLRFEWRGTRWLIGPVPLGGFVRVAELGPEHIEWEQDGARWFSARCFIKRVAVIVAGPAANYGLAAVVAFALAFGWGIETGHSKGLKVVSVDEGARQAGLAVGDLVSHINGHAIESLRTLSFALADSGADGRAVVSLTRGGLELQMRMPRLRAPHGAWGLGAGYIVEPELRRLGPLPCLVHALVAPIVEAHAMLAHAAAALAPRREAGPRPLGIVGLADRVHATKGWDMRRVLMLAVSLSVAMGLFNLLPFPGLDGGRLFIEMVQAARRRRLPARFLVAIQVTGGLLLLAAWILLTGYEIGHL